MHENIFIIPIHCRCFAVIHQHLSYNRLNYVDFLQQFSLNFRRFTRQKTRFCVDGFRTLFSPKSYKKMRTYFCVFFSSERDTTRNPNSPVLQLPVRTFWIIIIIIIMKCVRREEQKKKATATQRVKGDKNKWSQNDRMEADLEKTMCRLVVEPSIPLDTHRPNN